MPIGNDTRTASAGDGAILLCLGRDRLPKLKYGYCKCDEGSSEWRFRRSSGFRGRGSPPKNGSMSIPYDTRESPTGGAILRGLRRGRFQKLKYEYSNSTRASPNGSFAIHLGLAGNRSPKLKYGYPNCYEGCFKWRIRHNTGFTQKSSHKSGVWILQMLRGLLRHALSPYLWAKQEIDA